MVFTRYKNIRDSQVCILQGATQVNSMGCTAVHQLVGNLSPPPLGFSKVELSRNRPWRPIGFCGVKDPTLSRQLAYRWR
jgi:hypothetical protein